MTYEQQGAPTCVLRFFPILPYILLKEESNMREFSGCLKAILALPALLLYMLALLAAMVGMFFYVFSIFPDWLPAWLQFIATVEYFAVTMVLLTWFVFVTSFNDQDLVWLDVSIMNFSYILLLWVGLVVAAIVITLTL